MKESYTGNLTSIGPDDYQKLLELAFAEDHVQEDVSTFAIFDRDEKCKAYIFTRQPGVLAGLPVAMAAFHHLDPALLLTSEKKDSDWLLAEDVILRIEGNIQSVLRAERVALNFLTLLSGIATHTRRVCEKLAPLGITPLDTRKTIPGLRNLSKYAVAMGGGVNHRLHLAEMGLIKDNHIAKAGSIGLAIKKFRRHYPALKCEVEVETIAQLKEALAARPDMILLDNMQPETLAEAGIMVTSYNRQHGTGITTEASGGFTLDNLHRLANSGVDYVSLGSLTSRITPLDLSLEIDLQ